METEQDNLQTEKYHNKKNGIKPTNSKRINALDKFRYITVTFALISHIILWYGIDISDTSENHWFKFFTRLATPSLIVLFGVMIEVVYYDKYKNNKEDVHSRLTYRAFLCYIVFIILSVLAFFTTDKSLLSLLASFALLKPTPLSNIFILYFFYLLLAIPILYIRKKFDIKGVFMIIVFVWILDHIFLKETDFAFDEPLVFFGGLMAGVGQEWGPSIFHGLTLVTVGVVLGNALYSDTKSKAALYFSILILLTAAFIVYDEISKVGISLFVFNIVEYKGYRANNSIVYYSYGFIGTIFLIVISYVVNYVLPQRASSVLNYLGRNTFPYFALGNALLLILPRFQIYSFEIGLLMLSLYLIVFGFLTFLWDKKIYRSYLNQKIRYSIYHLSNRLWGIVKAN